MPSAASSNTDPDHSQSVLKTSSQTEDAKQPHLNNNSDSVYVSDVDAQLNHASSSLDKLDQSNHTKSHDQKESNSTDTDPVLTQQKIDDSNSKTVVDPARKKIMELIEDGKTLIHSSAHIHLYISILYLHLTYNLNDDEIG